MLTLHRDVIKTKTGSLSVIYTKLHRDVTNIKRLVHCTLSLQSYTTGNFGLPRATTYAVQPLHEQLGRRQKNPYAGETVQSFNVSPSPRGRPRNVIDQYADGERP